MERGTLIVVEGGVGSGKTTMLRKLANNNLPGWHFYMEPGGTPFGNLVRHAVQGNNEYSVDPYAELFAYCASRANLVRGVIISQLNNGEYVGLDRYWYSTYAYQGARGISKPLIFALSKIATAGLQPDLVLHYDLDPEIGIERKRKNVYKEEMDRLDREGPGFHRKVRKNYHQLAILHRYSKTDWSIIDASKKISEVYENTVQVLRKSGIL